MPKMFIVGPTLAFGLAIGLYEAIVIHRDVELLTHRFMHTIHAILLSILLVFVSMNAELIISLFSFLDNFPALVLQISCGLLAAIKIHAVTKLSKTSGDVAGTGETWFHSLFVGALIIAAPYASPFVKPLFPTWLLF